MDNTSSARIKQAESFSLAIRRIRSRLGLSQAALASKIGCNQNTVSRYEGGKQLPSVAALTAVWNLAEATERHLLMAHLRQEFSLLDSDQQRGVLQAADEGAKRQGGVPPSVLARMFRVCEKYKSEPDAAQLIDLAASWLEAEFEMRALKRTVTDPRLL
ncbi:MAG: helix-turn-helix domain-containing protein [Bryobacteraceae bacterium]